MSLYAELIQYIDSLGLDLSAISNNSVYYVPVEGTVLCGVVVNRAVGLGHC